MSKAKFSCEIEQLPKGEGWRLVMCENGKEVANDTFAAFPRMDAKKGLILAYREAREVAEDWLKTRVELPGREAPWPELLCRESLADGNTVSVYSLDFDFSQCFWRISRSGKHCLRSKREGLIRRMANNAQTRHRRRPAWLCGGGASPTLRTLRQLAQRQALFAKQERGLRAVYNLDLPLPQGETRSGRVPCVGCVAA